METNKQVNLLPNLKHKKTIKLLLLYGFWNNGKSIEANTRRKKRLVAI
jgi:hypothetical protein